jgi:transcriptional regulator with XRE-family HTH domain
MGNERTILKQNIARKIAEFRKKKGLTQDEFALKAGVTGGYVRLLESGKQNLTLETLDWLGRQLNCNPKAFFDKPKTNKATPGRPKKIAN